MPSHVCLLDALPELSRSLNPEQLERARGELLAPVRKLRPGPWEPPTQWDGPLELGLLVVGGLLARDVQLGENATTELIGRGDLLRPADHEGESAPVPVAVTWTVLEEVTVAHLDSDVTAAVTRWPVVLVAIVSAAVRRSFGLAQLLALSHLRRVDSRLLVLFWHLADRWGRVHSEGVVVPVRLTHELIGRVVGAQRPSVTTALNQLEAAGRISRRADGGWILHGDPPSVE